LEARPAAVSDIRGGDRVGRRLWFVCQGV